MIELPPGIYERLITEGLMAQLDELTEHLPIDERPLNSADASDRIAWHVRRQVERALLDVSDDQRVQVGLRVARALLDRLGDLVQVDRQAMLADPASVLYAVLRRNPDGSTAPIVGPLIPLLDTTLLTNAPGEPTLWSQLRSEIDSADSIDVVMAFIRRSGIGPLLDSLRRHCDAGNELRVLTTTYTDSTERRALDQLVDLGAEVRISYDLGTTRLHAKAWVFHRRSGFSTAYVGSSNLTHSAQVTGPGRTPTGRPGSSRRCRTRQKVDALASRLRVRCGGHGRVRNQLPMRQRPARRPCGFRWPRVRRPEVPPLARSRAREGHLDHGYAMTIHKAQGLTADEALVLATDDLYQEAGYTALSRARLDTRVYVVADDFNEDPSVDLSHGAATSETTYPIGVLGKSLRETRHRPLAIDH